MSHEKIFTQFPGDGASMEQVYHFIDINQIEAISQTETREICLIYTAHRYYRSEIDTSALDEGNFPAASDYCYQILANAAIAASEEPMRFPGETDDEDNFGPATFHGDPEMPL